MALDFGYTIEEAWQDFRNEVVVEKETTEAELEDLEMSFKAGIVCMMEIQSKLCDPSNDKDLAAVWLRNIFMEMRSFLNKLEEEAEEERRE